MGYDSNRQLKASITVFLSLTIIMVMSLVLSLVEVVHFYTVKKFTEHVSKIGTESSFGDFCRPLFDDYGIMAVDTGYCNSTMDMDKFENRITEYLDSNLNPKGASYIRANVKDVNVLEYGLLTDSGGAAFIKEAAKEVGYLLPESVFGDVMRSNKGEISDFNDQSEVDDMLIGSKNELNNINRTDLVTEEKVESTLSPTDEQLLKQNGNPIDSALEWKSKSVLEYVIEDMGKVSQERLIDANIPSKEVFSSNSKKTVRVSAVEKALYMQYLKTYFSYYGNENNHSGLKYEWEYVINAKPTDIENLEATINKLILIREATNFAFLTKDAGKQAEALSIATAICAGIAMPTLIEPVKWGIIAAWAYLESVLDVRLLLSGGRIAPIKTAADWTSNILLFPNYLSPSVKAKENVNGLSYTDYLMELSIILSQNKLGLRSLDVVEDAIIRQPYYESVRIKNFIYQAKVNYCYESTPIFAFTPILEGMLSEYNFENTEELSFL